ncbi:hypothetical protein ACFL49_00530 [Candidatus Omnitrophota bacterium]
MDEYTAASLYGAKNNCVKAVLKAFQPASKMADDEIVSHAKMGGGRAPEGRCGALYAALQLPQIARIDPQKADDAFREEAGSTNCQEIRQKRKLTCRECVALGARLLTWKNLLIKE